jgi:hypothetical protein
MATRVVVEVYVGWLAGEISILRGEATAEKWGQENRIPLAPFLCPTFDDRCGAGGQKDLGQKDDPALRIPGRVSDLPN